MTDSRYGPTRVDSRQNSGPSAFESLAFLYTPADRRIWRIAEAKASWQPPPPTAAGVDIVLWGREPDHHRPTLRSFLSATRREIALARLRAGPPAGLRIAAVHRLAPATRAQPIRRAVRSALNGGLLVELVRGVHVPRVLDEVMAAAGGIGFASRLRPSGDGSALARLALADGQLAELRIARVGHAKDPQRGRAALIALADAAVPLVPRPLAAGRTAGAAWTTETVLPGGQPGRITPRLVRDVADLCARLRSPAERPHAIHDHLDGLARVFPRHARTLSDVAAAAETWAAGLPPVVIHGDLWRNNLLVRGGRLTGVVDWDTWHPAGLPGTDLVDFLAMEEGKRIRRDVGPLWTAGVWRSPTILDAADPYWRQLGIGRPDEHGLAAIGVGWWASRITASVQRANGQVADPAWVRRNVDDVLEALTALLARLR